MIYVEFSNTGYTCFDESNHFKYSEDATHKFLFEFITKDFFNLTTLLDEYFSKRFDSRKWEVKNFHKKDHKDLLRIQKELELIHPFYKCNSSHAISTMFADYFTELSKYFNKKVEPQEYGEIMSKLLPYEITHISLDTYTDYYNKYLREIGESIDPDLEVLLHIPEPAWLRSEHKTQTIISDMLYYILDIAIQGGLEKLSIPQRAFFYEKVNPSALEQSSTKAKVSFIPHSFQEEDSQTENPSFSFGRLCNLNWTNIRNNGVPADEKELFGSALSYVSSQNNTPPYSRYEIDTLFQLLYLEIVSMVNANVMIRKCKNCGKYFVVSNRKIAYCDRIYTSGKRCSSIGSSRSFQQKLKEDEALNIYTRAYKTHHARVKKEKMSQSDFTEWCDEAKTKLEKARTGELDIADFQKWLKI